MKGRPTIEMAAGPKATLRGLGTATPPTRWPQRELAAVQAELWGLRGEEQARWWRIIDRSGVSFRAIAADPADLPRLSTAERMDRFETHAPSLAHAAARRALADAGREPREVTDLVVATCTGFAAPGLGARMVGPRGIGLSPQVRQLQLGFMGCFGGVAALRTAAALAAADPQAVVLAACVELCSLHLRRDTSPQNLVASALFADGAAAAVVEGTAASAGAGGVRLGGGRCRTLPDSLEEMTWRITDEGFAMTLSREVPLAVRRSIRELLAEASPPPRAILPHPGGPGILDAVEAAIADRGEGDLDGRGLVWAREILAEHGNMSSPTILFVLARAIERGVPLPADLVAFGPGLTVDAIGLR